MRLDAAASHQATLPPPTTTTVVALVSVGVTAVTVVGVMSLPSPPRLVGTTKCCPQAPFIYLDLNGVACPRPSTCLAVGDHDMALTGMLLRTMHGGRS